MGEFCKNKDMKRVLIAGGTGFAGEAIVRFFTQKGIKVAVLTRQKKTSNSPFVQFYEWDVMHGKIDLTAFEDVDTIINLTGANIGEKRWTAARKQEILNSRVLSTKLLYQTVKDHHFPIQTYVSSSAVGYYGAVTTETIFTEKSPNATDFLGKVCKDWEKAANMFESLGSRVVVLRKGVIIGKGGMYAKMAPLAQKGVNPCLGSGKNYLPWIDVEDLAKLYFYITQNKDIKGVYNAVSSEEITLKDFSSQILKSFQKTTFLPSVPRFLIQLMFGEMAVMLLEGSRVSNTKLLDTGFKFDYEKISQSFERLRLE